MYQADEVDEAIMAMLRSDGRISNRSIAEKIGVGESTVRNRIKRLEREKVMKLSVVCDVRTKQVDSFVFLRACITPCRLKEVSDWMKNLRQSSFVANSLGTHNLISLLEFNDRGELFSGVLRPFEALDGVLSYDIREILEVKKHRWDLVKIL